MVAKQYKRDLPVMFKFPDSSMVSLDSIVAIMPTVTNAPEYLDGSVKVSKWSVTLFKDGCKTNITINEEEYRLLESAMNVYNSKHIK